MCDHAFSLWHIRTCGEKCKRVESISFRNIYITIPSKIVIKYNFFGVVTLCMGIEHVHFNLLTSLQRTTIWLPYLSEEVSVSSCRERQDQTFPVKHKCTRGSLVAWAESLFRAVRHLSIVAKFTRKTLGNVNKVQIDNSKSVFPHFPFKMTDFWTFAVNEIKNNCVI